MEFSEKKSEKHVSLRFTWNNIELFCSYNLIIIEVIINLIRLLMMLIKLYLLYNT